MLMELMGHLTSPFWLVCFTATTAATTMLEKNLASLQGIGQCSAGRREREEESDRRGGEREEEKQGRER